MDGRGKRISQLDELITGIEADRDYWKNQVELLQQMLGAPSLACGRPATTNSRSGTKVKSKPPVGQNPTKLSNSLKDNKQRKVSYITSS